MKQEFGKRIRDLREDMDLNQTKLGKEVNMTQRKISYIENGTYETRIDDIRTTEILTFRCFCFM